MAFIQIKNLIVLEESIQKAFMSEDNTKVFIRTNDGDVAYVKCDNAGDAVITFDKLRIALHARDITPHHYAEPNSIAKSNLDGIR